VPGIIVSTSHCGVISRVLRTKIDANGTLVDFVAHICGMCRRNNLKIEKQEGVGEKEKRGLGIFFRACLKASEQRKIGLAGIARSVDDGARPTRLFQFAGAYRYSQETPPKPGADFRYAC